MKKLYEKTFSIFYKISALKIPVYSGNAAFFLLLAVFPAAMLLLTAVQYIPVSVEDLSSFLSTLTPAPVYSLMKAVFYDLQPGKTWAVLSAAAAGTVWPLTRSMVSLMKGLETVYEVPRSRPILKKWAISFFCAVILLVSILITLLLQVFGQTIYDFSFIHGWHITGLIALLLRLRTLFSLGFLTVVFCTFYTVLPARRLRFIRNLPGALLSALVWLIYSTIFGFYVENFSNYSMIYGSLTAVIITLLWIYFCINILFYGGLFNRFLNKSEHPFRELAAYFRDESGGK